MALIHLIRHAKPTLTGVFLGSLDVPLENEDLAPSTLEVVSIAASPLQRARRTAELLFPHRKIEIIPELAEVSFGEWAGKSWDEIEAQWPELAQSKSREWRGITPPGGESWEEFEARVAIAWNRIRPLPRPCAIVAHGGVNSVLAKFIAGLDPFEFHQNYAEVRTFDV